jgi:hypothetical protein
MLRTLSGACLILLLASAALAQFQPQVTYPVGTTPFSIAIGDFNGDGHPDLAVTNSAGDPAKGLSILLGNGDGTFQPHVDYATGGRPTSIVTADFNGDGRLDLAIANSVCGCINVLLGNGDGTFQAHVDYAAWVNPQWLVAADFNGDGRMDIATTNYGPDYSSGTVSVLLGKGDGSFESQVQYYAGTNPFGVMSGDFNRDGIVDLAVVCNNGNYGVWILPGNGDGTFQPAMYYASGTNPRVGVVADMNSDGNLDIAIGNCISNNASVLLGDGNGHFAQHVDYPTGTCPQTLAAGDFDGDGNLDLVSANAGSAGISVLMGKGDGTFPATFTFAAGNGPIWAAVADLNHDTAPDVVVSNSADNTVSVLLNIGTDFSISATAANPPKVARGQSSTSTVSLFLLTSYNSPVTLTCTVQPAASAPLCSFSQNPLVFDAQKSAATTVTFDTGSTSALRGNPAGMKLVWLPVAGFALLGATVGSRRRKLAIMMMSVLLAGGLMFQAACGSSGGTTPPPSQPQTYTVTITGTAGSHQHSTTTALTVQ